jgi:hypothetical protein
MNCHQVRQHLLSPDASAPAAETTRAAAEARAHMGSCGACRAWQAEDERFAELLLRIPSEQPPVQFKQDVMKKVHALAGPARREGTGRPLAGPHWWRRPAFLAQGAFAAVALALLFSPAGRSAVVDTALWVEAYDPATSLAVPLPTIAESADALGRSISLQSRDALLITILCGLTLAGNWLVLQRTGKDGPGGGRGLKCLVPLAAAGALFASSGLAQAAGAQEPTSALPPETIWRSLEEASDALRFAILIALTVFGGSGLVAIAICIRAYCRRLTLALDRVVAQRSGAYQFFIGLFNFVLLFGLAVVFSQFGPLKALTLGIIVGIGVLGALGFAARVYAVGRDILGGARRSELATVIIGGAILVAVLLLPIAGQILWAGLLVQCLGTGLLGLFERSSVGAERDATVPVNDRG